MSIQSRPDGMGIIAASVGSGLAAQAAFTAGVSWVTTYNTAGFRMLGRGSLAGLLPFGNANQIAREIGREVLSAVPGKPVSVGLCGTDPFVRSDVLVGEVHNDGFTGVQNFPTVGMYDGAFADAIAKEGFTYDREIELISSAAEIGLQTAPYVFSLEQAIRMSDVGANTIVIHAGSPARASTTETERDGGYDLSKAYVQELADGVRAINREIVILCHAGPVREASGMRRLINDVPEIDGFLTGSDQEAKASRKAMTAEYERLVTEFQSRQ